MAVLCFWFWSVSEICHFLCLSLMRSFVYNFFFFIFQDLVWLVKSSWCVHCCTIHQFFWVSDRCRSEFALWWFFVRKKLSQYWQFFFLFSLDQQTFLVFINLKDRAAFLGLIMHFSLVDVIWECLIIDFSFFLWNHVFLCVYQWCGFSRYKFFHFWSQCLVDIIISMCSFLFFHSNRLG